MSTPPEKQPVAPAGEQIHLPPGSLQPLLLTVGTTIALVGVTFATPVLIIGLVLVVAVLFSWIKDARHEMAELPLDHDHH